MFDFYPFFPWTLNCVEALILDGVVEKPNLPKCEEYN